MTVAALDLGSGADLRFILEFTEADGTRRREPLAACVTARLEDARPVRSFSRAKGASPFNLYVRQVRQQHPGDVKIARRT